MRILITGGAGYIGSVIVNFALQNGYKVRVVDNLWFDKRIPLLHADDPAYEFIKADLRDELTLDRCLKGADIVIHAAAVVGDPASKKFPELTTEINHETSIKLINKANDLKVKGIIFLSTCSNYGVSDGMVDEEAPLKPLSLYAKTKVGVEKYLMSGKGRGLDWVICRLSTAYGSSPRMRFDLTVNDFTMTAFTKKQLSIFLPYTYRPYIHVSDIARVMVKIVGRFDDLKNKVFNIGFESENYQKIQIADIVRKLLPETTIDLVKSGADLRDYKVDFSKLKSFLNIENMFTVEGGAREVLELLRNQIITNPYEARYSNTMPKFAEESAVAAG